MIVNNHSNCSPHIDFHIYLFLSLYTYTFICCVYKNRKIINCEYNNSAKPLIFSDVSTPTSTPIPTIPNITSLNVDPISLTFLNKCSKVGLINM